MTLSDSARVFICPFSQLKGSAIADGEGLPQYKSIPEKCKSTDTKRAAFHKREAAFFRFFTESWGKSSLGARLRTRKVRGRDASLPAPLLAASLGLVGRGTVGALPQTPQGTLSLDPFSRLSWSRFHAPSACSFLVLCLSSCLLPKLSVKNLFSYPHPAMLALPRSPFHHTRAPPAVRTHNKRLYRPIRPEVRRSQVYHRRQRINLNVSQIVPAEQ